MMKNKNNEPFQTIKESDELAYDDIFKSNYTDDII